MYCVWRNLWNKEEDDEEGDGIILVFFFFFWETFGLGLCSCLLFWFGVGLCCACDTEEYERRKSWSGFYKEGEWVLGRNSEKQLLKSEFLFYNANVLKIMMTWKIVRVSKASFIYIYIYIYIYR